MAWCETPYTTGSANQTFTGANEDGTLTDGRPGANARCLATRTAVWPRLCFQAANQLHPEYQERNSVVNSKVIRQEGVAAGVGGLGNVLIGKLFVVVSSKQQA